MTDAETMVLPRLGPREVGVEDPWEEGHDGEPDGPAIDVASGWRVAAWLVPALLMGVARRRPGRYPRTADGGTGDLGPGRVVLAGRTGRCSGRRVTGTPYHLLMRAWAALVGSSDLALRVPSILAMTAAAALVGALAARLFAPGTGVLAGVVFALLPTSARYAQEAQPYALTLLAAVLATSLLVPAIDRPRFWRFAGYAGAVVVLGLCNVVALLLLVGHGWAVFAFRRAVAVRWLVTAARARCRRPRCCGSPSAARRADRAGLRPSLTTLAAAPGELFGVAALGAVLLGLALFSLPLRYSAAVFTAWAVVPPLGLLLVAAGGAGLVRAVPALHASGMGDARRRRVGPGGRPVVVAVLGGDRPDRLLRRSRPAGTRRPRAGRPVSSRRSSTAGWRPGDGVVQLRRAGGGRAGRTLMARYPPPTAGRGTGPPWSCRAVDGRSGRRLRAMFRLPAGRTATLGGPSR